MIKSFTFIKRRFRSSTKQYTPLLFWILFNRLMFLENIYDYHLEVTDIRKIFLQ